MAGFVGGSVGSILSHPFDYYKTLYQSGHTIHYYNYRNMFTGVGARMMICSLSMTIGNWSYNYLLNNWFHT